MDELYTAFFTVIEGFEEFATAQFHHPARDGSYRLLEATVGKLVVNDLTSVVLSMRSIDTRRVPRVELPSRQAASVPVVRAKDRFLAMIAHELRTPLMPVLLAVEELEEEERFTEARPVFAMIRRNVEVQTRLIEELTDFALVGEHKVRLRLEAIDLHETLRFVLGICQREISDSEDCDAPRPRRFRKRRRGGFGEAPASHVESAQKCHQVFVAGRFHFHRHIRWAAGRSDHRIHRPRHRHRSHSPAADFRRLSTRQSFGTARSRRPRPWPIHCQRTNRSPRRNSHRAEQGPRKGATFCLTLPNAPPDRAIPPTETDARFLAPCKFSIA